MDVKDRERLKDDQYGKKLGELVNAGTEQLRQLQGLVKLNQEIVESLTQMQSMQSAASSGGNSGRDRERR